MQNQGSIWLNVRRDRPDWIYNQGWGAMNPTAVKEAIRIGFPIDKLVGVWWAGGDDDARAGGAAAKGYKSLNFHAAGTDFPVIQDIQKHVVDKGLSKHPKEKVGENLYNRGVYNSMLIAEAIRNAQKITGKKVRHRRGRAPRPREPQHHRGAPQGARHGGLRGAREGLLRRP